MGIIATSMAPGRRVGFPCKIRAKSVVVPPISTTTAVCSSMVKARAPTLAAGRKIWFHRGEDLSLKGMVPHRLANISMGR